MTHLKRHAIRALAVALGVLAIALCALAAPCLAGQSVRVGTYNIAPLTSFEDGQARGFFPDVLRDLAKKEGWDLVFVPGTWDECFRRLHSGEIDLLPNITRTQEREASLLFTEEYLTLDWAVVYRKKGASVRTVFDLQDKRIGVLRASAFNADLLALMDQFGVQARLIEQAEYAQVMRAVASGEVDAGVCPNIQGVRLSREYAVEPTDIIFAPTKIRAAVRRGGREDVLLALDRHLAEGKARQGSWFYVLHEKWLGLPGGAMLPGWAPWVIGAIAAALGVLAAFVAFLRLLVARRTRELAASQAKYRALVEDQTELVSRFTAGGVFLYVNPAFCRFFGKAEAELLGTRWAPVVYEEDLPHVREELARLGPKQPVVTVENRNVNAAGEVRWLQFTNRALFDARGDIAEIQSVGRDITERKRAEQALRASEAFTRAIMENLPIGIAVNSVDPTVRFEYMNENFTRFYRAAREALARPDGFWEAVYEDPDERERMRQRVLDDCASGDPARMVWTDVPISRQGEPTTFVSARNVPVPERGLMISTVWDVTAHKRAELALRESELRFRTLADSGQALIWTSGPDKLCDYFNGPWLAFTGRTLEQELGNGWAEGVHPDDFARCLEVYVTAFDARESFSMEYRLRHASGAYRWIVDQGTPRFDSEGAFLGYIGHCLDITGIKQAEAALAETAAFTESLLNVIPNPIFIKNRAGVYTGCNDAFSTFVGLSREELLGRGAFDLYAEEEARTFFEMDEALMAADGVQRYDFRFTDKRGERRDIIFNKAATHDAAGGVNGLVGVVTDITDIKRAEAALAESEGRLSLAVGMARLGHWELDVAAGLFTFSDSFYAIYHTTAKDMGGYVMSVEDYARRFVHPEDRHLVAEETRRAMEASDPGFARVVEHRCLYADGGVGHVAVRFAIEKDAEGRTVRTHGVNQDITGLRQAEAALAESRRVLEMILNTVPQSIFWKDRDSVYLGCNQAFALAAGLPQPLDIVGRTDFDLPWKRQESEAYRADDREVMATGQGKRNYVEAQTQADGRTAWVETSKLPLLDGSGRAVGVMGIYEDITERKLTEETLQFLVLGGCDGSGEDFFPSLARYLARTLAMDFVCIDRLEEDGLSAQTVAVFHDGHFEDNVRYALADTPCGELVENRVCFHPEGVRQRFPDDQVLQEMRAESYAGVILWDHLGRPIGLIAVIGRRTAPDRARIESVLRLVGVRAAAELERLDAQSQLVKAKEAAEAASRAKGEFLANMSHELRTPMNGVLGMLQLLMLEELKPAQQDYAHKAFEAADRLLSLLNDILDFSRIEAGVLVFKNERFHPADVLAAARDVFGLICGRKGLALQIVPDPELPDALMGDEARIRQVVFNLAGNAVKFTHSGGVRIEAWYNPQSGSRPGFLCIAVSDSGVGIPADKLSGIFDRFSQADASYTRQYEGAGLGLAIVRRIVESMGGSLCIESGLGQGTNAVLVLPAPLAAPSAPAARLVGGEACVAPEATAPLRILLAEDELIGQLGARVLLERMGHRVVAVGDGRSAVEKVLEGGFDCVLMDIQMPEMDGLEATRLIRSTSLPGRGRIPIVAMTAYALSGDREKFLAAGMDGYIAKPFQMDELRQVLCMVAGMLHQGRA